MEIREKLKVRKLGFKIIAGIILFLIIITVINFIPTWNLKSLGMNELNGSWVNLYYEKEESAAKDVFIFADYETEMIAKKLGFTEKQEVSVYVYDYQNTMQTKKYGYIAPLLGLNWYIGDNIGTNVILTSPANPGKIHDYDNNKYAVMHEIVHAYMSVINKDIDLWLNEGIALYLSNGEPFYKEFLEYMEVPSYKTTCSKNPIKFSNAGGYTFAHIYIEYLDKIYGWDKVLELVKTEDYEYVFKKTKKDIYTEWVEYMKRYPEWNYNISISFLLGRHPRTI